MGWEYSMNGEMKKSIGKYGAESEEKTITSAMKLQIKKNLKHRECLGLKWIPMP
jgi:hypothetical protein